MANTYFRLDYNMGNFPYTSFHFTHELAEQYRRLCTSSTSWEIHEIHVEDRDKPLLELCCATSKERVDKEKNSLSRRLSHLLKNYQ
jgi:hypothetical protein